MNKENTSAFRPVFYPPVGNPTALAVENISHEAGDNWIPDIHQSVEKEPRQTGHLNQSRAKRTENGSGIRSSSTTRGLAQKLIDLRIRASIRWSRSAIVPSDLSSRVAMSFWVVSRGVS